MQLKEKLITTPRREDAGGRTSNRFSFQHSWAMQKLLELVSTENDFVLIMEFFDDVIVLDSSTNPQMIDFYQIKTNNKKTERFITTKKVVTPLKDGLSIAQKLIDNLSRFPGDTRSIHLVSNKAYKFDLLDKDCDSTEKLTISLNEFCEDEFAKIKANICKTCHYNKCLYPKGCSERCRKILYFDVSDLGINNYDDTVFGRFVKFLTERHFGDGTISNSRAVYNTLMSEIVRINNNERKSSSFEELLMSKSITKAKFDLYLKDFQKTYLMKNDWIDISNALRFHSENYGNIEINLIRKQWDKYRADCLESDLPILDLIKSDIREIIESCNFESYREYIDYVHLQIKDKKYYQQNLYDKHYYTAVVLGELYYE